MIDYAQYCQIRQLSKEGFSSAKIAAQMGINEKTVRRWRAEKVYRQRPGAPRTSKLEPFKAQIQQWIAQADFSIVQIYQKLTKEGYQGGRSIVGEYVRQIRPKRHPAYQTLHYDPASLISASTSAPSPMPVQCVRPTRKAGSKTVSAT